MTSVRLAVTKSDGALGNKIAGRLRFGPQRPHQVPAQVLHPGEWAVHGSSEQRRRGGIRTEEARRRRDEHAVHYEVVQRDVVSTKPPTPETFVARLAEHPQVIQPGSRPRSRFEAGHEPFGVIEHVL